MNQDLYPAPLVEPETLRRDDSGAMFLEAVMRPVVGAPPADVGTIASAHRIDLDGAWSEHASGLPHTLLSPAAFAERAGALGITRATPLVIFDRHGIYSAPRLWFNFTLMGCETVRLLHGGVPAWRAAGGALAEQASAPTATPTTFIPALRADWLVDATQVMAALADGSATVIDVRSRERFSGAVAEPRPGLARGHMPGAINLPFPELLEQHRYKPAAALRDIFISAGAEPGRRLIFSCGSGVTACIGLLAARLAGFEQTALYDGAWAEWGARPELPKVSDI